MILSFRLGFCLGETSPKQHPLLGLRTLLGWNTLKSSQIGQFTWCLATHEHLFSIMLFLLQTKSTFFIFLADLCCCGAFGGFTSDWIISLHQTQTNPSDALDFQLYYINSIQTGQKTVTKHPVHCTGCFVSGFCPVWIEFIYSSVRVTSVKKVSQLLRETHTHKLVTHYTWVHK